jgi:cardiolipin synthase (CMP-forming)
MTHMRARFRITANQVTFARLIAIPLLCVLLYGDQTQRLISLFLGTAVGFTDLLDGYLARKYGPTILGGLMDPIADKVFVAATLLCLGELGWVPWWLVHAVLIRELVVTALRSSFEVRKRTLRTTYLAKVKTWVQMFVIAVVTALHLLPLRVMTIFYIVTAAAAVLAAVASLLFMRRRWVGIWIFAAFFVVGTTIHLVLGSAALVFLLYIAVIAITWGSALDYVTVAARELAGGRDFHVFDSWRLLGAVTIPVLAALCVQRIPSMTWALVTIVCVEICHGGLDNLLANAGAASSALPWAARTLSVAALLAAALALTAPLLVLAALAVTTAATTVEFVRKRRYYLA